MIVGVGVGEWTGLRGVDGEGFGRCGERGDEEVREGLVLWVESDEGQAVAEEVAALFLAGADDAFKIGERGGTGCGAIDTAIRAGGGDAQWVWSVAGRQRRLQQRLADEVIGPAGPSRVPAARTRAACGGGHRAASWP